jgi:hypothetical protein
VNKIVPLRKSILRNVQSPLNIVMLTAAVRDFSSFRVAIRNAIQPGGVGRSGVAWATLRDRLLKR